MHKGKYSEKAIQLAAQSLTTDTDSDNNLPWVASLEDRFAKFTGFKFAIAVNSGTSGLHASLLSAGIGPGDEVISPALTVIMDAFATVYTGAVPVFADIENETWNMDPNIVESLITSETKAIIALIHLSQMINTNPILEYLVLNLKSTCRRVEKEVWS